jgi:hypothetical protein
VDTLREERTQNPVAAIETSQMRADVADFFIIIVVGQVEEVADGRILSYTLSMQCISLSMATNPKQSGDGCVDGSLPGGHECSIVRVRQTRVFNQVLEVTV